MDSLLIADCLRAALSYMLVWSTTEPGHWLAALNASSCREQSCAVARRFEALGPDRLLLGIDLVKDLLKDGNLVCVDLVSALVS